jgi:short chain dehydrogenase
MFVPSDPAITNCRTTQCKRDRYGESCHFSLRIMTQPRPMEGMPRQAVTDGAASFDYPAARWGCASGLQSVGSCRLPRRRAGWMHAGSSRHEAREQGGIDGGYGGIGRRASARLFAKEGATVFIAGRSEERGDALAAQINDAGGKAHFTELDVVGQDQWDAAIVQIREQTGALLEPILWSTVDGSPRRPISRASGHTTCSSYWIPRTRPNICLTLSSGTSARSRQVKWYCCR